MSSVFVAWVPYHQRTSKIAGSLGARVHFVSSGKQRDLRHLAGRYTTQARRTWRILVEERPDVVFVQNPPIFCALTAAMYARRYQARLVIDSHTGAFLSPRWRWSLGLHRQLSRRALTTIVTNDQLARQVTAWGASAFKLAFTPADCLDGDAFPFTAPFNVAVVSAFDWDEPLDVVFAAAQQLPDVDFYVTGNPAHAPASLLALKPANCHLTGYLPDRQYTGLLQDADAVMDLTTKDHTLLQGAFEAVSLGTPLIVSDWPVLREYFSKGTIHIPNTVDGVAEGVRRAKREGTMLRAGVLSLREHLYADWERNVRSLRALIGEG